MSPLCIVLGTQKIHIFSQNYYKLIHIKIDLNRALKRQKRVMNRP